MKIKSKMEIILLTQNTESIVASNFLDTVLVV